MERSRVTYFVRLAVAPGWSDPLCFGQCAGARNKATAHCINGLCKIVARSTIGISIVAADIRFYISRMTLYLRIGYDCIAANIFA